jgi:RNA polymerase sigma-70 factor, ECF subfamily
MQAEIIQAPFGTTPRLTRIGGGFGAMARLPVSSADQERNRRLISVVAQQRDKGAFLSLFSHFAPRLKAYMKRLGTADELAEELAQDVMFTVWRKAETYDPAKSAVSSWIFTIARNLRIDALRREHRRAFDLKDPLLEPQALPQPDAQLQQTQQQRRMRALLDRLPRDQAAVVSLAFYAGKSHGEIAAYLAIPLGTVKSRMRLAFQHLREALEAASETAVAAARLPAAA